MNYKKIYDQIIDRAKTRDLEGYGENHHIIPKCMGGDDKIDNLVKLTVKEHYIVHRLLTEIYPGDHKLIYAFWCMCSVKNKFTRERTVVSARTYEYARNAMSKVTKERLKEHNPWLGKTHSEESKKKMSESAKNRQITLENETKRREGISRSNKKPKSKEHSANISKSKLGSKNPMYGKKGANAKAVEQLTLDGVFIEEWRTVSEAARHFGCSTSTISNAASGKTKKTQGYVWRYKQTD